MKKAYSILMIVIIAIFLCSCGAAIMEMGKEEYLKAPEIVFTTTAEENGYSESYMYVDGTAGAVFTSEKDMEVCEIQTDDGIIAMIRTPMITSAKEWKKLKEGETVRVKFMYLGYSDVLDKASGALISVEEVK